MKKVLKQKGKKSIFSRTVPSGLTISDSSIKFIELAPLKKEGMVTRFAKLMLPEGLIVSGAIQDFKKFTTILSAFVSENRIKRTHVSFPEMQSNVSSLLIPIYQGKSLPDSIEFHLETKASLKKNEIVFDYSITGYTEKDVEVSIATTDVLVFQKYLQALADAGLIVTSCELETKSLARSLVSLSDPNTYLIVDFGRTKTTSSLVGNGTVYRTSTVNVGGKDITERLEKKLSLSYPEAEHLKCEQGLNPNGVHKHVFQNILPVIETIRDHIQKEYIRWSTELTEETNKKRYSKINSIILTGGGSNMPGLLEYIIATMGVQTNIGNAWININTLNSYVPVLTKDESLAYAATLGLALKDFAAL